MGRSWLWSMVFYWNTVKFIYISSQAVPTTWKQSWVTAQKLWSPPAPQHLKHLLYLPVCRLLVQRTLNPSSQIPIWKKNKRFHSILNPLSQDTKYDISVSVCAPFYEGSWVPQCVPGQPRLQSAPLIAALRKQTEAGRSVCLRLVWSIEWVSRQPGLPRETSSQKTPTTTNKNQPLVVG